MSQVSYGSPRGRDRPSGPDQAPKLLEVCGDGAAMISQTAEYALRAVVWLAAHDRAASGTSVIAEGTGVPAGYLSKVLQCLARHGLVISTSGRHGGFRLARAATEVSVLDVIQAVAPFSHIRTCPLKVESHEGRLCPLHRRLNEAMESLERAFAAVTIGQLLQEQGIRRHSCGALAGERQTAPLSAGRTARGKS